MTRICHETGAHISEKHDYCPHCGDPTDEHPKVDRQTETGRSADEQDLHVGSDSGAVLAILVFAGIGVVLFYLNQDSSPPASTDDANDNYETVSTVTRYAEEPVNVRAGPGMDHKRIDQLNRRESVRISRDSSTGEWAARYDRDLGQVTGYVSKTYLSEQMPERKEWVRVTRSSFEGDWPFTVPGGEVGCKVDEEPDFEGGTQLVEVPLFRTNGTTYALTGHGQSLGYNDFRPIWRDSPGPVPKVSVDEIKDRAEQLCP